MEGEAQLQEGQRAKLGLVARISAFFSLRKPESGGLRSWFRSLVDELEDGRFRLLNSLEAVAREIESEGSSVKASVRGYLAEEESKVRAEVADSTRQLSEALAQATSQAQKEYVASIQVESGRFKSNFTSEMDRVSAEAAAELNLWGARKNAEVRKSLESSIERTHQTFAADLQEAEKAFRAKLDGRCTALLERYDAATGKILDEATAETRRILKDGVKKKGQALLSTGIAELTEAVDRDACGILTEFNEAARKEVDTALGSLRSEVAKRMDATKTSASQAIEELSRSIDRDIGELRSFLAEQVLNLRDQVRHQEDLLLQQASAMREGIDEALAGVRGKATRITGRLSEALTKVERKTRRLESEAGLLAPRHAELERRLTALEETLSRAEGAVSELTQRNLDIGERAAQVTDQVEAALDMIEGHATSAREYLAGAEGRLNELRARLEDALRNYEAQVAEATAMGPDVASQLDEARRVAIERARGRMDAELEYALLGFSGELRSIERSILSRGADAERSMARNAIRLVGSDREKLGGQSAERTRTGRPACPSCNRKLRYIQQYTRWYCDLCRKYAPKGIERTVENEPEGELRKWFRETFHPTSD